jgi:hypothetical protein
VIETAWNGSAAARGWAWYVGGLGPSPSNFCDNQVLKLDGIPPLSHAMDSVKRGYYIAGKAALIGAAG